MKKTRIAVVILAAGSSSRMGEKIKQLLPWGPHTLLTHTINEIKTAGYDHVYMSLGASSDQIIGIAPDDVRPVVNPNWACGLGSNIAFVSRYIQSIGDFDAILFALGDQPLILSGHYDKLLSVFDKYPDHIVATSAKSYIGVPAIIPRDFFDQLIHLSGDRGAGSIIRKAGKVKDVYNFYAQFDIDTREQYTDLLELKSRLESGSSKG